MDLNYEFHYHELEEQNWWFAARRDMLIKVIRKLDLPTSARILDIGCSGGATIKQLNAQGYTNIYGIDISATAIALSKKRGIENTQTMDGTNPAFEEGSFDLIIASDVLEHLKDDNEALANWYKLLRSGGIAIIFVPAFQSLWSNHDVVNHHFRRYTKQDLKQKAVKNGFSILKSSYWNATLFFPVWIVRRFFTLGEAAKGNLTNPPTVINNILIGLLKVENTIINYLGAKVGVSCYIVGSKK